MSNKPQESVVLITSSRSESKYKNAIGTGFVIYREAETTYVLTCAHVVKAVGGVDSVQIYGKQAIVIVPTDIDSKIDNHIENFDLAVLQIKHEDLINSPVLKLRNFAQEGTSVEIAGNYLFSEENKRSLANIQGILGKQIFRVNQDTGKRATAWKINISNKDQLQKGYSGSPVVELDTGFVIGVVTNMGTGGQTGDIISVEALKIICPSWLIEKLEPKLDSVKNVDYSYLRDLLEQKKWKEADKETAQVMLQAAGRKRESEGTLEVNDIEKIPCEDLCTINQLWIHYSKGKFGFSVQKEIYKSMGGNIGYYNQNGWVYFENRVGWMKGENALKYSELTFNLESAVQGHLPLWCCGCSGFRGNKRNEDYSFWGFNKFLGARFSDKALAVFSRVESCNL